MGNTTSVINTNDLINKGLINLGIITFVYFMPAISHLLSFPVYLFDPMRIMVVMAIIYSGRKNAHLIALTLPIFSFLISGHPLLLKALIMSAELTINVWLFYVLKEKIQNNFLSLLGSIILAKVFYYIAKFAVVNLGLLAMDVISTALYIQLGVALALSLYIQFAFGDKRIS